MMNKANKITKDIISGLVLDAFQNQAARTGFGTTNLLEATQYPLTRLTWDYQLMTSLYRSNWIARRIIDTIPKDMLKNGWEYQTDQSPQQTEKVKQTLIRTKLKRSLRTGLNWGRLYGGAAGLMMIEGQEDRLDQPLDLDEIYPGDFKGLLVVDRWSGIFPQMELVDDISNPEFGLPKYYQFQELNKLAATASNYPITGGQVVAKVHHSRIVRFPGDDLPIWEMLAENYWGASKLESCFEELKKRDNTSANIAGLIFQAQLKILKMEDLGEVIASTSPEQQKDLYNTIQAQNALMSNFGMYMMSKEDEFQSLNYTFSGINEIYESFMMDVSGAAQIPVTKLFGRSPAGMNATGESDMRNYYDVVEQDQESCLRPALEKLLPVICMSTLGQVPDDLDFHFNPVLTPSDEQLGNQVKYKTEAIFNASDRGLISDRTAMMELKTSGEEAGLFTTITDEDINAASAEPRGPLLSLEPSDDEEDNSKEADEGAGRGSDS